MKIKKAQAGGVASKKVKAPKVVNPKPKENYMKESDTKNRLKSKMWPLKSKRLSK